MEIVQPKVSWILFAERHPSFDGTTAVFQNGAFSQPWSQTSPSLNYPNVKIKFLYQ